MKVCPNCGNSVEESARFCNICGSNLPEAAAQSVPVAAAPIAPEQVSAAPMAAPAAQPKKDPTATAKEIGGKVADSAKKIGGKAADFAKELGPKIKAAIPKDLGEKVKKVPKKIWMIGGGVLAALIVLIIVINVIGGSGMDYNFAMYVNEDNQLSYTKLSGKGDPVEITEEGYSSFQMADDSKTIFYLDRDEDGELCLYYRNATKAKKDPVLLESNVSGNFVITPDGSKVYFMKKGNLYVNNLKKSEKIESDVDGFLLAADGKKVLYQNDDGELYIWNGKKSVEVDSDVEDIFYWSEDLKEFYYLKDEDLYLKKGSKEGVKVLSDCTGCAIDETGKGYAMNDDQELYYIDGKKAKEIASDVTEMETVCQERSVAVYSADDGEEWYVAVKAKAYQLDVEDVSRIRLSADGKTLYMLLDVKDEHGDLVKISIGGKPGKVKDVDEDVYYYDLGFTQEGKFYYFKDVEDGEGTLIFNGKEVDTEVYYNGYGFMGSKPYYMKEVENGEGTLYVKGKEIVEDVIVSSVTYNKDKNTLLFITEWDAADCEGMLNTYKSKVKEVADKVYYSGSDYGSRDFFIMPDGQVLYFTDYDLSDGEGVLNCFNGSKSVELADDAKYYIPVYAPAED